MIQFALQCSNGHRFDAWFRNAAAFDEQQARGIVSCAVCSDGTVEKALMAPAVATSEKSMAISAEVPDPVKMRAMLRVYRQQVMASADNVGTRFADEARKIHFEEIEARGIYGQATRDEVAALIDDGIDFMPLPDLADDN